MRNKGFLNIIGSVFFCYILIYSISFFFFSNVSGDTVIGMGVISLFYFRYENFLFISRSYRNFKLYYSDIIIINTNKIEINIINIRDNVYKLNINCNSNNKKLEGIIERKYYYTSNVNCMKLFNIHNITRRTLGIKKYVRRGLKNGILRNKRNFLKRYSTIVKPINKTKEVIINFLNNKVDNNKNELEKLIDKKKQIDDKIILESMKFHMKYGREMNKDDVLYISINKELNENIFKINEANKNIFYIGKQIEYAKKLNDGHTLILNIKPIDNETNLLIIGALTSKEKEIEFPTEERESSRIVITGNESKTGKQGFSEVLVLIEVKINEYSEKEWKNLYYEFEKDNKMIQGNIKSNWIKFVEEIKKNNNDNIIRIYNFKTNKVESINISNVEIEVFKSYEKFIKEITQGNMLISITKVETIKKIIED